MKSYAAEPEGTVLGVDANEDFSRDLQYRFDHVPPYAELRGVQKLSLHARHATATSACVLEREDA